ncbi:MULTISPECIES: hypothetical protein [Pseudomonas]|uniref:hypothetical protein n=1 Tax=Pseudomonas TaxID=286 RepID=UPI00398FF3F5
MTDDDRSEDQPLPPCSIPASCQISFRGIPEGIEWQEKFIAIARKVQRSMTDMPLGDDLYTARNLG